MKIFSLSFGVAIGLSLFPSFANAGVRNYKESFHTTSQSTISTGADDFNNVTCRAQFGQYATAADWQYDILDGGLNASEIAEIAKLTAMPVNSAGIYNESITLVNYKGKGSRDGDGENAWRIVNDGKKNSKSGPLYKGGLQLYAPTTNGTDTTVPHKATGHVLCVVPHRLDVPGYSGQIKNDVTMNCWKPDKKASPRSKPQDNIVALPCTGSDDEFFVYDADEQMIKHISSQTCIGIIHNFLVLEQCHDKETSQKWIHDDHGRIQTLTDEQLCANEPEIGHGDRVVLAGCKEDHMFNHISSAPSMAPSISPAPSEAPSFAPTTESPTVTPGNPSAAPTTAAPTTAAPSPAPSHSNVGAPGVGNALVSKQTGTGRGRLPSNKKTGGSFGDPHIKTWDGNQFDFMGGCDLILLSIPSFDNGRGLSINIRTSIKTWWSFIESAVIRVGQDTMEVMGGKTESKHWLNGQEGTELQKKDSGILRLSDFAVSYHKIAASHYRYRIDLGLGSAISLDTFKEFVSVNVAGKDQRFEDSVGLMGSYPDGKHLGRDGATVLEDANEFGQEWQVRASEPMLFHKMGEVQHPVKCAIPNKSTTRKRRLGGSSVSQEAAEAACSQVSGDVLTRRGCVYDVLATQDLEMAKSYLE